VWIASSIEAGFCLAVDWPEDSLEYVIAIRHDFPGIAGWSSEKPCGSTAAVLDALIVLYGILALWVAIDFSRLPDRIATHFQFSGEPDGWASRTGYASTILVGAAFTGIVTAGAFALPTRFPDSMINLPNKEYWLAEGRRERTLNRLVTLGLCIACLTVALFIGMHVLVVRANAQNPARLPGAETGVLIVVYTIGLMTALIMGLLGFSRAHA
jgi:hypothetical protein